MRNVPLITRWTSPSDSLSPPPQKIPIPMPIPIQPALQNSHPPILIPPPTPMSLLLLSDDIVLNILAQLEPDPRHWARLACASSRLAALVRDCRIRSRVAASLPPALAASIPAASLHTLAVCCPGLRRSGVLLHHSDFGLHLDIGPDHPHSPSPHPSSSRSSDPVPSWSLFDDLYFDSVYDSSESDLPVSHSVVDTPSTAPTAKRKKEWAGPVGCHLASGAWTLSREQGNKLLASRFRGDSLYICDWPGCVHAEEKRKYMLFRGVFTNFKRSMVWRTINDGNRSRIGLQCAFCECREMWDLHSAFCLRRVFGFHDDGEPVVRAYVCENGHVAGAWTERQMYA